MYFPIKKSPAHFFWASLALRSLYTPPPFPCAHSHPTNGLNPPPPPPLSLSLSLSKFSPNFFRKSPRGKMETGENTEAAATAEMESSLTKRLWRIVRVVYYMFRRGISKRKLMLDIHLLLHRGKIAGKALGNLMTFHHHHHHNRAAPTSSGFSCWYMDPNLSFYDPREVEFSCSNTPAYATKRKNRHRHDLYKYDVAAISKAFEILNSEVSDAESVMASPSPAPIWSNFGRSPAMVRQLRITDSPFPTREEDGEADGHVDRAAEEFIKRFYEQLRLQQSVAATPEYTYRRQPLAVGRA